MASGNENLNAVQATNLVFQYAENLAKKIIEQNNERLQGVSEREKEALKRSIKEYYIEEFIKELEKKKLEQ